MRRPILLFAAAVSAIVLAATPAAAFHKHRGWHHGGHHHGPFHYSPHYAYYPPVYPVAVVSPPVIATPVIATPVVAAPVVVPAAVPVAPAPVVAAPIAAATAPSAPGVEGTPGCLVVREYTTEIEVGGKPVEGYGYACLQADGSWKRGAPAPVR